MRLNQAVQLPVLLVATPATSVKPLTTLGNRFAPLRWPHVFEAAGTSLSFAVSYDNASAERTVRCRTVAETLSIGVPVRRLSQ